MKALGVSGSELLIRERVTEKHGRGCQAQAEKIKSTAELIRATGFTPPKVLDVFEGGYSMRTIHGVDAMTYLHLAPIEECLALLDKLVEFVRHGIAASTPTLIDSELVERKIISVLDALPVDMARRHQRTLLKAFRECDDFVLPLGFCHGDLTLSNLIVSGGEVHLLDSIPVFLESPILDVAKLLQDACHFWTMHLYKGQLDVGRMYLLMFHLRKQIRALPFTTEQVRFFSALNLARILPYVLNNPQRVAYVEREIAKYD